jgi:hypothetical protein
LGIAKLPGDFPDFGHRVLLEGTARSDRQRRESSPDAPPGNRPFPQLVLIGLLHEIGIGFLPDRLEEGTASPEAVI